MILKFNYFKIIILSLFLFTNILPQRASAPKGYWEVNSSEKEAASDSLKVELRIPPSSVLDKYQSDPDFNYNLNPEEPQNWIEKFWRWLNNLIDSVRNSEGYYKTIDYLLYGLMAATIIVIIIGLIKSDIRGLFYGKRQQRIRATEYVEDIHQLNFDELISNAIENKNYKLVIRYLYLKTLKVLSDNAIIELNINKTNHEYYSEIKNLVIANSFNQATRRFEWIWYGSFPVDKELFSDSEKDFNELLSSVKA